MANGRQKVAKKGSQNKVAKRWSKGDGQKKADARWPKEGKQKVEKRRETDWLKESKLSDWLKKKQTKEGR